LTKAPPSLPGGVPPPRSAGPPTGTATAGPPPAVAPVVSREVRAAAALRALVIGALGALAGGMMLFWTAYDLGGPVPDAPGVKRVATLALAAAVAGLGAVSFVRALVTREELARGADGASIALVTLVLVPLAAVGLGGYAHTHPPDKRVRAAVPYTFSYPGSWDRNRLVEQVTARREYGYVLAFGRPAGAPPQEGVLVVAFIPRDRASLEEWVRTAGPGVHAVNERRIEIAGRRGIMVDYERTPGRIFQSQAAVLRDDTAYVVTCFREAAGGEAGCQKVLDTFRFM